MGTIAFLVGPTSFASLSRHQQPSSFVTTNYHKAQRQSLLKRYTRPRFCDACASINTTPSTDDEAPTTQIQHTPTSKDNNVTQNKQGFLTLRRLLRIAKVALPVLLLVFTRIAPAISGASSITGGSLSAGIARLRAGELGGFTSGLTAALALVLASEIGDKTFFISMLLSMKYSKTLVLLGTILALGIMTVISVGIGQIFHALPSSFNSSIPFDDYAAIALLCWFGFQNIRDAFNMTPEEDEELADAKDVVNKAEIVPSKWRVVTETFSLVFVAEWGDKSMLATVALAAAKSPWGVVLGGISGHFIATVIAVIGGSVLAKYISERNARLFAGVLFFLFAALTFFGVY